MKTCSGSQYAEGRVCVTQCSVGLFANPLTRECETSCPAFDELFAEDTTRTCVSNCSFWSNSYADRNTRTCIAQCSLSNEYALDGEAICTSLCPSGKFMENSTKKCISTCLTGYA